MIEYVIPACAGMTVSFFKDTVDNAAFRLQEMFEQMSQNQPYAERPK